MLTDYTLNPYPPSYIPKNGWKAFIFGEPEPQDRWLQSHAGPGFHIFLFREDAEDYIKGVDFGVVKEVQYHHVRLIGSENGAPALTADFYEDYSMTIPKLPEGPVVLILTSSMNIPVTFGGKALFAQALPGGPNEQATYGLFADDKMWMERVAIKQPMPITVHVVSGGSVIHGGKIIGKIPELGDTWIYGEAYRRVLASFRPDIVADVPEGHEPA